MSVNFETIDCESLDEFWNYLSPIGNIFGHLHLLKNFIYRGQWDSAWTLSPMVYRAAVIEKYKTGMMRSHSDNVGQTIFEWSLLFAFVQFCDQRGLAIAGDSVEFRNYITLNNMMAMNGSRNDGWPQERITQLMAMAQHHGIPTRLLDWTSNAYVACYFAAAGAIAESRADADKRIAVYGFDCNPHQPDAGYRYIHVPGSTSPNLSAQNGSFILVNNTGMRGENFTLGVSLESRLSTYDRLVKLTLPICLAAELLHRCYRFGISAASVFPGYDGAARAVMERNLANSFVI